MDLVWLLHHLFYGKAKRPALEGFDDVLWVLRLGLKAPAAGPLAPARRPDVSDAAVGLPASLRDADGAPGVAA